MLRSKDDIRLLDGADCYIKRKKMLLPIRNGVLYDPSSHGSPTVLDFFQMNKSHKMVHIDYKDVMIELANVRTRCPKRFKHKKRLQSVHKLDLLKTIKDLQEKVALVTDQLSHALLPAMSKPVRRRESLRRSRSSESEQRTHEKISPLRKIVMEKKESSKSMFSDTEEEIESKPIQKYKDFKHIDNAKFQSTNSESETDIGELNNSEDSSQSGQRTVSPPLKAKPSGLDSPIPQKTAVRIDAETLQILGRWASRNRDFFPYKGMTCVPEGTFENDDEYFLKFLSMLNPTVQLVAKPDTIQIDSTIPSNIMNQDEFSKKIGLVRVRNTRNDGYNDSDSKISNNKPRLLRKRKSMASTSKSVSDQPQAKSGFLNLRSKNVRSLEEDMPPKKKTASISEKNDKPTVTPACSSDVKSVKSNEFDKLRSSFGRVLNKVDTFESKIPRDHRSIYTEEEDRVILKWVLKDDHSMNVKGNKIWVELERKGIMPGIDRSWQSLRNRFIRTILSQLRMYGLSYNEIMQLRTGAVKGSIKTKKNNIYNPSYASVMSTQTGKKAPSPPATKSPRKLKLTTVVTDHTKKSTENKYPQNSNKAIMPGSTNMEVDYNSSDEFLLPKNLLTRKLYTAETFVASDTSSL